MKLFTSAFLLLSASLPLSAHAYFYFDAIRTLSPITATDLRAECQKYVDQSNKKIKTISDQLFVRGAYGREAHNYGTRQAPNMVWEYYCQLQFSSKDAKFGYKEQNATFITHISDENWDTACKPAYDETQGNPRVAVAIYDQSRTLIQGRTCSVPYVLVVDRQD